MKDAEDEAFDELAKRQGHWGGGYQAKKAMAADKLQEPPSEWAGIKAILDEYGLQAIDFVADFKAALAQPAQEPVAWLEPEWGEKICPEVGYEATITDDHPRDLCWIPLYTASPKRPWVGLTDEDCIGMSAGDKVVAMWANRILKEKNT